ncbi:YlbF family regulator [Pseudalkalibacillus caeni]|nr:YlbF family regulator [Pseudalkalibacillus caeni]
MEIKTDKSPILTKTEELCKTILDQPEFTDIKTSIDSFFNNEEAKSIYQNLYSKQQVIRQKQQQGTLTDEEFSEYKQVEEKALTIPEINQFINAQQQMHKIEETIKQYVSKTFQLGRVPEDSDFEAGSCGPSCGCS